MRAAAVPGCVLALVAVGGTAFFQQQPVFRVTVDRVRLDALVTAAGRPVQGLGATASLITFSDRMALGAGSVRDPAAVRAALVRTQASGRTAMWDALFAGLSFAARDTGRSLVLLFSDGVDNASWLTEKQVTESLKHAESVVYAVHPMIESDEDTPAARVLRSLSVTGQNQLRKVAVQTGGSLLEAEWSAKLSQQFAAIVTEFRSRYLLLYEPAGVGRNDEWHRVEVRVKGRSAKVQVREGYYATPPGQPR